MNANIKSLPAADKPRLVRLNPTKDNLVVMVDLLCAMIETRIMPALNSPLHHTARWLVDDSGHKPKRKKTRLKHLKPGSILTDRPSAEKSDVPLPSPKSLT